MGVLCLCPCKQRHYTSVPSRETIVQAKQNQRGSSCDCTCCCDQEQVGGTAPNDIIMTIPDPTMSQSGHSMEPKWGGDMVESPRAQFLPFFFQILQKKPRDSTPALCEFQKGVCHGQGLSARARHVGSERSHHNTPLLSPLQHLSLTDTAFSGGAATARNGANTKETPGRVCSDMLLRQK